MQTPEGDPSELLNASDRMLFDALLHQTQDQVYFKDRQSRFVRASDVVAQKFGLDSVDELMGRTDFDFFTKEHAQQSYDDEQRLMNNDEKLVNITEKETWPDGSVTWATSTKIPLHLASGNVVGMMGITRDVTEQINAQIELEEKRDLLRAKNEVMQTDFDNARRIQRRLIPGDLPSLPFVEVAATSTSLTEVSGDLITFPTATDDRLSFLLGDVSGHGVSAGLFTILIKHLADFYFPDSYDRLDKALLILDEHLTGLIPSGFVASLAGSLTATEPGRCTLTLANAGQPSAFWFHSASGQAEIVPLPSENVIGLGICGEVDCQTFELEPGDCFLFVSDGAIECRDPDDEELGLEGLKSAFEKHSRSDVSKILEQLQAFLKEYSQGDFPQDDTSLLAIKTRPPSSD